MGGLSRRAYILNKIRKEESKPVLVIDAGAMLFPQPYIAPTQLSPKSVQAGGLIEAMAKMNYDAIGIAPQDLSAGAEFLLNQPAEYKLPWLSMNLADKNDKSPLFKPYVIKTIGKLNVGILGLSQDLGKKTNRQSIQDYQTTDWKKKLSDSLEQLTGKTDLNILLSSMPENINRQIAKNNDAIHIIIQSGTYTGNKPPLLHGNALITQVSSRGKYIGRLNVQWHPSQKWSPNIGAQVKQTKDRLDRVNWQLGRLTKRNPGNTITESIQYKKLVSEKNLLTGSLRELEAKQTEAPKNSSSYQNSFISLSVSLPEDPEIRAIVLKTKLAVNKSNKSALTKLTTKSTTESQKAFAGMSGWKVCQSCHKPQTEFWLKTNHSLAWETLVKAKQQFNPECLICHVTLPSYDKETVTKQNLLANLREEYKTIGCETCHGPSKNHSQQPDRYQPLKPGEKLCLICHIPERDDNFIFKEKLDKIRCPGADH